MLKYNKTSLNKELVDLDILENDNSSSISLFDFNSNYFHEVYVKNILSCYDYIEKDSVTWINIVGYHNIDLVEKISTNFGIHDIVSKNIFNVNQYSRIEEYGDYLFIILKTFYFDKKTNEFHDENINIVLSKKYIITFHEHSGDIFDNLKYRLKKNLGHIRSMGTDYLLYWLIDSIIHNHFLVLDRIEDIIDSFEDYIIAGADKDFIKILNDQKKQILFMKKSIFPLKDISLVLQKNDLTCISKLSQPYFRDLYNRSIEISSKVDSTRDMIYGLIDLYISSVSNKMNEIMKVLTIISTIFIPLTFLAGLYGMNFKYMPELEWKISYPILLTVMFIICISMLIYFKRKKWF